MLDSLSLSPHARAQMGRAAGRYHATVIGAREYLEGRGISEDDVFAFNLGYVDDPLPGHERFLGWVCIPYMSQAGVLALKFRRIDGSDGHKYDGPSGQKMRLFNAQSLSNGGSVAVVCEGEFDAIAAQRHLSVPSVGAPGASSWQDHWSRCFGDFDRVIVVADNDIKDPEANPGKRHAEKAVKAIGPTAELVLSPAGMDLSEWIESDGPEAVRKAMAL